MAEGMPVTVVETPDFLAAARKIMSEAERMALVDYLARNPVAGDLIPGSGGVRKLRWHLQGRGKRGGARAIYFFHSDRLPLFALDVFAKNERAHLTQREVIHFRSIVKAVASTYAAGGNEK